MYHFDSRQIQPGDTYICLPKGEPYIQEAQRRGAVDVVTMTRQDMAELAHRYFGEPSEKLTVIGITGTNGKTTVAYWTNEVLNQCGFKSIYVGTLNQNLTTPESWTLQSIMHEHYEQGGTHIVLEVSSHAIAQHRIDCIDFDVTLLTNITQDHLDYHESFEEYKRIKHRFVRDYPGIGIEPEQFLEQVLPDTVHRYPSFNYENKQSVAAIMMALKTTSFSPSMLSQIPAPPGRFQHVSLGQDFDVVIDYAHTPDALERCLESAKKAFPNAAVIWVVFGCGGDRDRGKRSLMGEVAHRLAGHVVLTNDNPRGEDPAKITDDIVAGMDATNPPTIIHDRHQAIEYALTQASPGDVVVVAGKGHESYQVIGDTILTGSDHDIIKQILTK